MKLLTFQTLLNVTSIRTKHFVGCFNQLNNYLLWVAFLLGMQTGIAQDFTGYDVTGANPNCYTCTAIETLTVNAVGSIDCGEIQSTAEVTLNFLCRTLKVEADGIILTDGLQATAGCESLFKVVQTPPTTPPLPIISSESLEIDKYDDLTISAEDIGDAAVYNWYDSEGNLILVGKDLYIANAVAEKYKLEVITPDGFIEYKDVDVKYKPNRLETLYPNPATNSNMNIQYKINEASSAYIMITNYYMSGNGMSNNYIIDVNETEIQIDLNSYSSGFYKVSLVADGEIVDVKILRTL